MLADGVVFQCFITQLEDGDCKRRQVQLLDRKGKGRIVRLKDGVASKSWAVEEVKCIALETGTDGVAKLVLDFGKTFSWIFEDTLSRLEFLSGLLALVAQYVKKKPAMIGFDPGLVKEQLDAQRAAKRSAGNRHQSSYLEDFDSYEKTEIDLPWIDLDIMLNDFNWEASGDASALESRLITELQALERANVHDIIQSEDRANAVVEQIDRSLGDLQAIEEWLLIYTKLLESMGQDVHQIEAQNKGMQVTRTNQRALYTEIDKLMQQLQVPGYVLDILKTESMDSPEGVEECERAIDRVMAVIRLKFEESAGLAAVKERVKLLTLQSNEFASRLYHYLEKYFGTHAANYLNDKNRVSQRNALKLYAHELLEQRLFKFKKLVSWLKETDARRHYDLQICYVNEMGRTYSKEIQDFLEQLKFQHIGRRGPEELEYLFVGPVTSAAQNVIKNAIKVGNAGQERLGIKQKLEALRNRKNESEQNSGNLAVLQGMKMTKSAESLFEDGEDRMPADEAFGHALLKLGTLMVREQNFIMDFFGLVKQSDSLASPVVHGFPAEVDAAEAIKIWQDNLNMPHELFKDPKAEKRIMELMMILFEIDVLRDSLLGLIELGVKHDMTLCVGMMVHLEFYLRDYNNTCHIFITNLLEVLHKRVESNFEKFVSEQIKGIEDVKINSKKRSGILPFVKTFPRFVGTDMRSNAILTREDRLEKMLSNWDGNVRKIVDRAYAKIIKCMFETVDQCALLIGNDPKVADEKDTMNTHILTLENMHSFYTEIRSRKVAGLEEYVKQAKFLYDINLELYCKVVIRKPLGKLLEFFEGVEALLKTGPANEVSFHVQYSKNALKDVIKKFPGKEIKKSLVSLYSRVEKHFSEEGALLQVVWRGIQEEFTRLLRKWEDLIAKCYSDSNTRLEFTMDELLGYFTEMAKGH